MARKRKVAPNPAILRLMEQIKKEEAKREERWVEVGQLAEECGIADLSDAELRAEFKRIANEQKALPKAA